MKEIISYGRFVCGELTPHKNRGMEITYIEKGMLEWMVEGVPEKIGPGTVFFTLPWQVHGSLQPREPDNLIWHILFHLEEDYPHPHKTFRFPPVFGFTPGEMRILSTAFSAAPRHGLTATPALRRLMPELIRELQGTHELREAQAVSLLRLVLVELKRIITGEALNEETRTWPEKRVQKLLNELAACCDHRWTLHEMAVQCGLRRTRFTSVFQKLTGGTPVEYLTRLRVERAKTLLRESGARITDIALECGFSSSQYFANTFRRFTGLTPSEYRTRYTGLSAQETARWKKIGFRSEQEERRRVHSFIRGASAEPGA